MCVQALFRAEYLLLSPPRKKNGILRVSGVSRAVLCKKRALAARAIMLKPRAYESARDGCLLDGVALMQFVINRKEEKTTARKKPFLGVMRGEVVVVNIIQHNNRIY